MYSPRVCSVKQPNQYQPADLSGMVLTPDPSFFLHMIHNMYARSTMHDPRTHPAEEPRRFGGHETYKHTNDGGRVSKCPQVSDDLLERAALLGLQRLTDG